MNCKLFKFCWIFILPAFFISYSFAQKNNRVSTDSSANTEGEDSMNNDYENVADTQIIKAVVDNTNDSIIKWKRSREFGYMAYLDSMLRKKTDLRIDTVSIDKGTINRTRATTNSPGSDNSNSFLNSFGVRFFFWIIAILFVGFILYKLFLTGGLFAKGNTKAVDESAHKETEILNDYSAYNLLIREAESKNDFNLSIRYLYLQSLKKLADNELISFSPDKANNLYVQELSGHRYQQGFAFLTRNYEYVWYGKFIIDRTQYQKLKEEFILFNKKV
jgi:hypothetical protein